MYSETEIFPRISKGNIVEKKAKQSEGPLNMRRLRGDPKHSDSVAQRSCGCPLPGSVQGQVGWSSEQPGLVEDVPAYGRGGWN